MVRVSDSRLHLPVIMADCLGCVTGSLMSYLGNNWNAFDCT
jgi:hypothetical protein